MAGQDLVDSIKQRLASGESLQSIRQHLLSKGWSKDDLDAAFASLPQPASPNSSEPLKLPFSTFWSAWDAKTSSLPTTIILGIFGFLAFSILLIAILLYNLLDPLGSRAANRDTLREAEFNQTQTALHRYYADHNQYPANLAQMVPNYLTRIPMDPSSDEPLKYSILDDQINYQLCVNYETRQFMCATSSTSSIIPTITPDDAPPVPSTTTAGYPITGKVFIDYNENGTQDSGEPVFSNASINVVDNTNKNVCSIVTDPLGNFTCNVTNVESYQVVLSVPARYRITMPNPQIVNLSGSDKSKMKATVIFGLAPIDSVTSHDATTGNNGGL